MALPNSRMVNLEGCRVSRSQLRTRRRRTSICHEIDFGRPNCCLAAGKEVDHVRVFAEKLRYHKELESRWAILHESRVEYFRGKDFSAVLRNHPDLKNAGGEIQSHHSEEYLGNLLLKRKLLVRCDRVVKTVRPGKKRLSKWPARIELFPDQSFSEDDAFFAWTFERRRPLWQIVLSFLLPVVTLACCLFPIFPHWCKLGVLYFCLVFLAIIFGVLSVRWAVFGVLWILLGWNIWFFPNILAEEATLTELFKFWPEKNKDDETPPKKTTRLAFALLTAASVWVCIHHGPNEAARARYQKKMSNIIDEVLVWKPNLAAISGTLKDVEIPVDESLLNRSGNEGKVNVSETSSDFEKLDVGMEESLESPDAFESDIIIDLSEQGESTGDPELEDLLESHSEI